MAGLRNEDYVAFLDESGESGLEVVAGVLIPARWLRATERRWRDFVSNHLGNRSGRTEVKGRELMRGEGVSLHAQTRILASGGEAISAKAAGRQFYRDALEHIARTREVRIITIGLPTSRPLEVYRLWFWLAYAALIERPRAPRPRLPLVVIDGQDMSLRNSQDLIAHRFYKSFGNQRSYMWRGSQWFVGGSALHESNLHPLVQMADLVAGAGRHAIIGRQPQGSWYRQHIRDATVRPVEISAHALGCLQALTPNDACGSGWPQAKVP